MMDPKCTLTKVKSVPSNGKSHELNTPMPSRGVTRHVQRMALKRGQITSDAFTQSAQKTRTKAQTRSTDGVLLAEVSVELRSGCDHEMPPGGNGTAELL